LFASGRPYVNRRVQHFYIGALEVFYVVRDDRQSVHDCRRSNEFVQRGFRVRDAEPAPEFADRFVDGQDALLVFLRSRSKKSRTPLFARLSFLDSLITLVSARYMPTALVDYLFDDVVFSEIRHRRKEVDKAAVFLRIELALARWAEAAVFHLGAKFSAKLFDVGGVDFF
jgi:hypothetical protein